MNLYTAMPLWVVMTSVVASLLIFALGEPRHLARSITNIAATVIKVGLVGIMLAGVARGHDFGFRLELMPGLELVLRADALTMVLSTLSAVLWLVTTIYAIGYLKDSPNRCRFFGFFSLCVAATMGVAVAGNLFTFFLFYELLTLATWPLVVHRGTADSLQAGNTYLRYTLFGGSLLLLGVIAVQVLTGPAEFVAGGFIREDSAPRWLLAALFVLLLAGMGVKAALVPLHGWLPKAMVAPAPVSALLHAVAVVKAGAFGIVRLIYDVFGLELTASLGMAPVVTVLAAVTIVYGSVRALAADELKPLLAWSTVSQISYIMLGVGIGNPMASAGGLVHLVHQGLMKITLFFCAGNFSELAHAKKLHELDGIGRRMPFTATAFTLAAIGMIGLPPLAGFVSKWYLGWGAMADGQAWVVAVLALSSVLNAAYFLPLLRRIWFAAGTATCQAREAPAMLLVPTLATALLAAGSGLLAEMPWSPLRWTVLVLDRVYQLGAAP